MASELKDNEVDAPILAPAAEEDVAPANDALQALRTLLRQAEAHHGDAWKTLLSLRPTRANEDARAQAKAEVDAHEDNIRMLRDSIQNFINHQSALLMAAQAGPALGLNAAPLAPVPNVPKPIKFPQGLPKFRPEDTNIDNFFVDTEALLRAHLIPTSRWVGALITQTSGVIREWVDTELLSVGVTWAESKRRFKQRYSLYDAETRHLDTLLAIKQRPGESVRSFSDRIRQAARGAGTDLDQPWIVRLFRTRIRSTLAEKLETMHPELHINFDEFIRSAVKAEHVLSSYRGSSASKSKSGKSSTAGGKTDKWCSHHKSSGHNTSECRAKPSGSGSSASKKKASFSDDVSKRAMNPNNYPKGTCYGCGSPDHMRNACPERKYSASGIKSASGGIRSKISGPKSKLLHIPVTVNEHKVLALLDTGADRSAIDHRLLDRLSLPLMPMQGTVDSAFEDISVPLAGATGVELRANDKVIPCTLEVIHDLRFPLILGMDLISKIGIQIRGLPHHFPACGPTPSGNESKRRSPTARPNTSATDSALKEADEDDVPDLVDSSDSDSDFDDDDDDQSSYPNRAAPSAVEDFEIHDFDDEISSASNYTSRLWDQTARLPEADIKHLMDQIHVVLDTNQALAPGSLCTHPASIVYIPTGNADPVYRPQYRVPEAVQSVVDDQVQEWLDKGTIVRAPRASPWNMPLMVASKKDLKTQALKHRVCLDPRAINKTLPNPPNSLPRVADLFDKVRGFVVASSLDLENGYNQMRIHTPDQIKTAFTWRRVRYMFVGTPFGLKHVTQHFQRAMEEILDDCHLFVVVYVDDVLVFSNDLEQHIEHLRLVISLLSEHNLRLRLSKCNFGCTQLLMLGHVLRGDSRLPDPAKISALYDYDVPETGRQVMAYLGFINYLRDYIPFYSTIAAPLERLRKVEDVRAVWDGDCQRSFDAFRAVLSSPPLVQFPLDGVQYVVATDASQVGIGAILYQEVRDARRYIAFASKSLNRSQLNYSATKRELLALVYALQRFRQYLFGTHFRLLTDHRSLTFIHTQRKASYVIADWMDVIYDYSFDVVHCPGALNVLPDSLSRLYPPSFWREDDVVYYSSDDTANARSLLAMKTSSGDRKAPEAPMTPTTEEDNDMKVGVDSPPTLSTGIEIDERVKFPTRKLKDFINQRLSKTCPSLDQRLTLLESFHASGHFGGNYVFQNLWNAGYFWPEMRQDCLKQAAKCMACIRFNVGKRGFHPLVHINAKYPFEHIAIDLAQFPTSPRGNNYACVMVCICTRYLVVRAIPDKRAQTIAWTLWESICSFGVPKIIQSDNGTEFVNSVISHLKDLMGIDHRLIAPYNPRANGADERQVGNVKMQVKKMAGGNLRNWDLYIPGGQLFLNSKVQPLTSSSAMALMFARPSNPLLDYKSVSSELLTADQLVERNQLVLDVVYPEIFDQVQAQQAASASRTNKKRPKAKPIPLGSSVMIKDVARSSKLDPYWVGPYKVVRKTRAKTYSLLDSRERLLPRAVPVDQLKLIALPEEPFRNTHVDDSSSVPTAPNGSQVVDKILDHRGPEGKRQYLVQWAKDGDTTWEPESHFDDINVIRSYWSNVPAAVADPIVLAPPAEHDIDMDPADDSDPDPESAADVPGTMSPVPDDHAPEPASVPDTQPAVPDSEWLPVHLSTRAGRRRKFSSKLDDYV
jgi:transposase InsO family protein